jgi:hypothetical protein
VTISFNLAVFGELIVKILSTALKVIYEGRVVENETVTVIESPLPSSELGSTYVEVALGSTDILASGILSKVAI